MEMLKKIHVLLEQAVLNQKSYLTQEEVRDLFHVGNKTIDAWIKDGLRKTQVPTESKSRIYYSRKDIDMYMNSKKI
ncbi:MULTISPECIES: helix-turn-helix domain-containing protein [Aerococcus]|nr:MULTISPECIES: helix-turn-helix domain-containing protein [Aerococcus]